MKKTNCPGCGAEVVFQSSVTVTVVCSHCQSFLLRKDINIETLGKVAQLKKEDTPLRLGGVGTYKGAGFVVVGRIQMSYDGGQWSEWHIALSDGRSGWLSESMGRCMISFPTPFSESLPPVGSLTAGQSLMVNKEEFTVKNIDEATYFSAEGELPDEVPLGEKTTLVDLATPEGAFATLDYCDDEPTLYQGEYTTLTLLKMTGLKPNQ